MVPDPNPMSFSLFFFFFFFYHAFIVSRFKKLRAALAMERTKLINQNNEEKKPTTYFSSATENLSSLKPISLSFLSET